MDLFLLPSIFRQNPHTSDPKCMYYIHNCY